MAVDDDLSPVERHHHRDVQGGTARAAVFGLSDGLVSNVGLILGVAGADPGASFVRLAGLAGLISGAISMAAGEFNSMRVQQELIVRELDREREALAQFPHVETVELAHIYMARGIDADNARTLAEAMMSDPDRALEAHAREELGIAPDATGSPIAAAGASFVAFSAGAIVPVVPWFLGAGTGAIVASLVLGLIAAVSIGVAITRFTEQSVLRTVSRQVGVTLAAVLAGYVIGRAAGVNV